MMKIPINPNPTILPRYHQNNSIYEINNSSYITVATVVTLIFQTCKNDAKAQRTQLDKIKGLINKCQQKEKNDEKKATNDELGLDT